MMVTMILMTMMMLRRLLSSWLTRPPPAQSATAVTRPPMSVLALELDNDVKEEDQDGEEEDSLMDSGLALCPWIKSEWIEVKR